MQTVDPFYRASLKEDHDLGRPTEVKAQFFDVYEMGIGLGLEMPVHRRLVEACGYVRA